MNNPLYKHNCTECVFLGSFNNSDLYFCKQLLIGIDTVVARHSDEGADYTSGLCFSESIPELKEAKTRAIAAGLMADEKYTTTN